MCFKAFSLEIDKKKLILFQIETNSECSLELLGKDSFLKRMLNGSYLIETVLYFKMSSIWNILVICIFFLKNS